jgi:hypothetical protein
MAFVRGHWRALGWVRSHRRSPDHPAEGQLVLPAAGSAAVASTIGSAAVPAAASTAGPLVIPAQRGPVEAPLSSARR